MMKALEGQTLIDIAIQELGSSEGAYALAVLNGKAVNYQPAAGEELALPGKVNKTIAVYYSNKSIKPATSDSAGFDSAQPPLRVFFEELPIEFT